MKDQRERIALLSGKKRALLEALLAKDGVDLERRTILPRRDEGPAPLSFGQERLWFLQRLEPRSSAYNLHLALRLGGVLGSDSERTVLGRALFEVVQRHAVLRSTFPMIDGEPRQVPTDSSAATGSDAPWTRADLGRLTGERLEKEIRRRAQSEADRPFDLTVSPPLRAVLLEGGDPVLLLTLHHIAADGWSMGLLIDELIAAYRASVEGRPSPLVPPSVQYADYAAWLRRRFDAAAIEKELDYWRRRLAEAPFQLALPTDRPRPAQAGFRGERRTIAVAGPAVEDLRRLAGEAGGSLFMALLALLQAFFHRHTGQDDLVIGAVLANRRLAELERLIGFFVETLALRGRVDGETSFRQLLARVRAATVEDFKHGEVPFEKVVEAVSPERHSSETPLFQVLVTLQNAPPARQADGLGLASVGVEGASAKFDLTWAFEERPGGGLGGELRFRSDLFDATTAERFARHFVELLNRAVAEPDCRMAHLDVLPAAERHQIKHEWSADALDLAIVDGAPHAVHELFLERAARSPEADAVVSDGRSLTFAELAARSARLAAALLEAGIMPGAVVALAVERSVEMVIGVLGILRAGGAYLYLEPEHPAERLADLLSDAGAVLLVTTAGQRPSLDWAVERGIDLVELEAAISAAGGEPELPPVDPSEGAYVIYTSGSTGRPKGVMVEHRQLVRHLRGLESRLDPPPGSGYALMQPLSVDGSIDCLFLPLISGGENGGAVHVITSAETLDPERLSRHLGNEDGWGKLGVLKLAPSHLATLLESGGDAGRLLPARLIVGGEASRSEWTAELARAAPHCRILNNYGPTETTVGMLMYEAPPSVGREPAVLPLGRPLAGARVGVRGRRLELLPIGAAGEIVIGGTYLSRGYLGRPARTAERFVPAPYRESPGERLYRSGDMGRFLADGRVEFLGRVDRQVKVRGFRVELGEIEAALGRLSEVGQAVVVGRSVNGENGGTVRLAAYVRRADDAASEDGDLGHLLAARLRSALPEHMVPADFVILDDLPRAAQGKIDLRALPAPEASARQDREAPRTSMEELVAGLWSDLLGVEEVGIAEDFFALGGHSLLATRLLFRLQKALEVDLTLEEIFTHNTVESQAGLLSRALESQNGADIALTPLAPAPRDAPLPLSPAQERLWFLAQLDPASAAYHSPISARLSGAVDAARLEAALNATGERHESLRTVFLGAGSIEGADKPRQLPLDALPVVVVEVDLRALPAARRGREARRRAREAAQAPFDLECGPLWRCRLLRLREATVLLLVRHHLISDEWSTEILLRETALHYAALAAGRRADLPPLPVQYADFAVWQRRFLDEETLAAQLDYWRRELDGLEPLELPFDRPRPAVWSGRGARRRRSLPAALGAGLGQLVRRSGATRFMALLAVVQAFLGRLSGRRDLALGTPLANRRRAELENVIGFFTNTLVMRADLAAAASFADLLAQARRKTLAAQAHQDVPFERLVEELQSSRDLDRHPLFQVMLAVQTRPAAPLVPGLELPPMDGDRAAAEEFEIGMGTAKFDLTLFAALDGERLELSAEYASDLLDPTTVDRWLGHLEALLAAVVEDPARPLAEISLLGPAVRHQHLVEWSAPTTRLPSAPPVHRWVEHWAAEHPAAIAAESSSGEALTYGELHRRSTLLASRLRALGVGPDVAVGIFLERSLDLLVAMQGVLVAGGAILTLDPTLPEARLAVILEQAAPAAVLSRGDLAGDLPRESAARVVLIEAEDGAPPHHAAPVTLQAVSLQNLVYLVYTSGSTGVPKGVAMTHAVIADLIAWHQEHLRPLGGNSEKLFGSFGAALTPRPPLPEGEGEKSGADLVRPFGSPRPLLPSPSGRGAGGEGHEAKPRVLHFAPLGFDVIFQEIFTTWAAGGTLVLPSEDQRRDPAALLKLLAERRIDRFFVPFVALDQVAATALELGEWPTNLREVITAGEQLRVTPAVREFFTRLPPARLHNHYGPSETHAATAHVLAADPAAWPHLPPIGRSMARGRTFVVERDLRPALPGAAGELALGGGLPARGYLDRPAETAARFVPDPFATRAEPAGGRLYLSGDLVRLRGDGELEFLGRRDHQVKIRGFRVEPGEIEARLEAHPAVGRAVVAARRRDNVLELVAWVVAANDAKPAQLESGDLRRFLAAGLPAYMVPSAIQVLDRWPLTATGKIDRRALPEPEREGHTAVGAPRDPVEDVVAGIWADVLGVERVGIDDDFFALGGHSLLATRVLARVREACGVDVQLRRLFEAPTVAGLASTVAEALAADRPVLPPLLAGSSEGVSHPLSFAQERLWILHRLEPHNPVYNLPFPHRLRGELDAAALEHALAEVLRRHRVLRTVYWLEDDEPRQRVVDVPSRVLPAVDLTALPAAWRDAAARRLARRDARRPFDLERGPVVRAALLRLAAVEHVFLLNVHHVAADGGSTATLVREIVTLYRAFAAGRRSPLAELPLSYFDWAAWQRRTLGGVRLEESLAWWHRQLTGLPREIDLPVDRPRSRTARTADFAGAKEALRIEARLAAALRRQAAERGASLFMALLAGFAVLLTRFGAGPRMLIGVPASGRPDPRLEALVGFFVDLLPLPADLADGPSFGELIERVRERSLESFAHQQVPFPLLVETFEPERQPGRHPLVQAAFNFLAFDARPVPDAKLNSGLEIEPLPTGHGASRFDLSLALADPGKTDEGPRGAFEYRRALFDRTTVRRLADAFVRLLESAAEDPSRRLADLALLSLAERHQTRHEFAAPAGAPLLPRALSELFSEQARLHPAAPAVAWGDESVSYGELAERARSWARELRRRGVDPRAEIPVAVSMERSPRWVAALWGILEAGAVYVPIDPTLPEARRRYQLTDSGARFLLVDDTTRERWSFSPIPQIEEPLHGEAGSEAAPITGSPDRLAWVIYTSGSTGRPKGAQISHRGTIELVRSQREWLGLGRGDRVLQFSSISFDASLFEILAALAAGATLVLPRRRPEWLGAGLETRAAERRITFAVLPPSLLGALPRGFELSGIDPLAVAGEACPPSLRERFAGGRRFFNLFGPTEATIWNTAERCRPGERRPTIGRPVAAFRVHVADRELRPLPIGASGELLLGGPGLARGYRARPGLTAERFVPDPFGPSGERLYRSGDAARFGADGRLDFLGRLDQQVKLRGFRVEPGEIEAVLAAHPALREIAVILTQSPAGKSPAGAEEAALVAYFTAAEELSVEDLRARARQQLPEHMVPSRFERLPALPRSASGKIDRRALARRKADEDDGPRFGASDRESALPRGAIEERVAAVWRRLLRRGDVDRRSNFFDAGGNSLLLVRLQERLGEEFARPVPVAELFARPTIVEQAELFADIKSAATSHSDRRGTSAADEEIAIIGLAGRFPGAADVDAFWRNLLDGVESIRHFSDEELLDAGVPAEHLADPDYVKAGGFLEESESFDAELFGISAREALMMDPQHRVFLECVWSALEHAGCDPARHDGRIGCFAGCGAPLYLGELLRRPELYDAFGNQAVQLANRSDFLPTRVSYKLDLEGPSVNVQTACSTSLVAVHLGCQSLQKGESDVVLAGGVTLGRGRASGYLFRAGGIHSPDGHCRAFDAAAGGTVAGQGAAVVVLKRLADALADGDAIHAVIKGSAINNDGSHKVSLTAPSVEGQAKVLADALAAAEVDPASVGFIEAHGTGTPLGDPIETAALRRVYGGDGAGRLYLGAVKSNIGHLDTAAGGAGLIKAVLALEHGRIPPTLHFERPHPETGLADSPFTVNRETVDWPAGDGPRRAAVSSFGIGGTNAHCVLEAAPPSRPSDPPRRGWQLLTLSARTDDVLRRIAGRLAARLAEPEAPALADVAFTLQVGRQALGRRRMVRVDDLATARERLLTLAEGGSGRFARERTAVFLFPGQGAQRLGMGLELAAAEEEFGAVFTSALEILEPLLGVAPRSLLDSEAGADEERLARTEFAQPLLFAVEYALARQWMAWGVEPEALLGHSLGEWVAACLAGVFSFEDALRLVAERGRLMGQVPSGEMLAVPLPATDVEILCEEFGGGLALAADNAPDRAVAGGSAEAIAELERRLAADGVAARRLRTSHAFHSATMDPVLEPFRKAVAAVDRRPPRIPFLSNVSGTWIRDEEAIDPAYWARQLRQPVRIAGALGELLAAPRRALLEIGPGRSLSRLARRHPAHDGQPVIASLRGESEHESLLDALGEAWESGVEVSWPDLHSGERRCRVPLPTYPFERRRYGLDTAASPVALPEPVRERRSDPAHWYYVPQWTSKTLVAASPEDGADRWLIFAPADGPGAELAAALGDHLAKRGAGITMVRPGVVEERSGDLLDPSSPEDFRRFIDQLGRSSGVPERIAYLWSLGPAATDDLELAFFAPLHLAQALDGAALDHPVEIAFVANGARQVSGDDEIVPERAALTGPLRVIPRELSNVTCRLIDVLWPSGGEAELAERLTRELERPGGEPEVAWRGRRRFVPVMEKVEVTAAPAHAVPAVRPGGVYLVTGGLGGVGWSLARRLAQEAEARLVLVGRTSLPVGEEREAWLAEHGEDDPTSRRLRRLAALEEDGAEVLALAADVTDRDAMARVVEQASERFGTLDGVIHAAGIAGGGLIPWKTREAAAAVLDPKIEGTRVLGEVLADHVLADHGLAGRELDFFVLCSSLASHVGAPGQIDYCAANAFVDAWAHAHSERGAVAIDWDAWREVGMAVETESPGFERAERERRVSHGLSPAEGGEAFSRALRLGEPQVAVSTRDLPALLERAARRRAAPEAIPEAAPAPAAPRHDRPDLETPYVAPRDELEERIAAVWQEYLGLTEIGVDDDFFALGGDSLVATQVLARLRRDLRHDLALRDLLERPTVAAQAALVEAGKTAAAGEEPAGSHRTAPPTASKSELLESILDEVETGEHQAEADPGDEKERGRNSPRGESP